MAPAAASPQVPPGWLTVAERTDFRATGTYGDALGLLEEFAAASPALHLTSYGLSSQGRPLPLVIVSREGAFTPRAAARLAREEGKPVLMIQNGIHAGEIDGKDASLRILREIALGGHRDLLEAATVLLVPILNVDGHERVSPWSRANQHGPTEGMGWRTNAHGLDLNRDHLKLQSREMRALLELVDRWRPHLHVDNHVTDGADHGWTLTWSWAEAPQAPAPLDRWLDRHMPPVLEATEAAGHTVGPYVWLRDRQDPAEGFSSRVANPWYATGYFPLRNVPSVLVEMHAPRPYRERVLANQDFLMALWRRLGSAGGELVAAVEAAAAATVERGRPGAEPSQVVVTWEPAPPSGTTELPIQAWTVEESVVSGQPVLLYDDPLLEIDPEAPGGKSGGAGGGEPQGEPRRLEVPWVRRSAPGVTAPRPRGYLVLPGWPQIEHPLAGHGLEVERLTAAAELPVETLRIAEPSFAVSSYQGQVRVEGEVERRREVRRLPAGSLWVPADQPLFEVAVQLLEPEAASSLFSWGLLSSALERKEHISPRNLESWARQRLEADPQLAEEWRRALEDRELATDPQARYLWWFRRTPWWDEGVGRMPYFRVMELPAEGLATEPWPGPLPEKVDASCTQGLSATEMGTSGEDGKEEKDSGQGGGEAGGSGTASSDEGAGAGAES